MRPVARTLELGRQKGSEMAATMRAQYFYADTKTVVVEAFPFRRFAELAFGTVEAARAMVRTVSPRSRPKRRYYHPHRESFIEDATMSREVFRL
jgi:hypothetical protein